MVSLSPKQRKIFILSCGTCAKKRELSSFCLCVCTLSHFLPSFLSLAHSLVTVSASPSASRPFISTSIPTISISHFSRFCLLTFHLSAEQIPLQLPKLCQKALLLFIYFFHCHCFSATSSLNGMCAGWNRFIIIWEKPYELHFKHLTDAFIHNNLQSASEKELGHIDGTQVSCKCIIGNCFSWQKKICFTAWSNNTICSCTWRRWVKNQNWSQAIASKSLTEIKFWIQNGFKSDEMGDAVIADFH